MQGQPQEALLIPELPAGTVYGKHEILQRLAIGGMAEIYLARVRGTAGFEKLVVLKRILPHFAVDPRFVQMFLGEARLAASLQHPNIADVYDVGQEGSSFYFTMEFVHGQDLRTIRSTVRKQRQGVPLGITLAIVHGALSALDYAHSKTGLDGRPLGLVHRDVSTSNVMISYDGAVKLLDFGIARASTQSSAYRTETGTLKGKIPYMSPEQCKGAPVDHRSDLWSLGVVLYELTVGQRPFRGESDFAIMDQIVNRGARSPREVLDGYPADLDRIVMRALARDINERYVNAEEMLHELEQAISTRGPWVSPKHLGKYMRQLFSDRIAAWENAQQAGLTLAQHVIEPITSQSHGHHVTPSSQPELAAPRPSQLMEVAAPEIVGVAPSFIPRATPTSLPAATPRISTGPMPAMRPSTPVTVPDTPEPTTFPTSTQVAPPRRNALRFIVIGGVAAILVAAVGIVALGGGKSTTESQPNETIRLRENTAPAPAPAAPAAAEAAPAAPAAAEAAPAAPAAAEAEAAPEAPAAPAAPAAAPAEAAPVAETPEVPMAKKRPTAKAVTRPSPKDKTQKQTTDAKRPKEEKWSQDSFSLPQ